MLLFGFALLSSAAASEHWRQLLAVREQFASIYHVQGAGDSVCAAAWSTLNITLGSSECASFRALIPTVGTMGPNQTEAEIYVEALCSTQCVPDIHVAFEAVGTACSGDTAGVAAIAVLKPNVDLLLNAVCLKVGAEFCFIKTFAMQSDFDALTTPDALGKFCTGCIQAVLTVFNRYHPVAAQAVDAVVGIQCLMDVEVGVYCKLELEIIANLTGLDKVVRACNSSCYAVTIARLRTYSWAASLLLPDLTKNRICARLVEGGPVCPRVINASLTMDRANNTNDLAVDCAIGCSATCMGRLQLILTHSGCCIYSFLDFLEIVQPGSSIYFVAKLATCQLSLPTASCPAVHHRLIRFVVDNLPAGFDITMLVAKLEMDISIELGVNATVTVTAGGGRRLLTDSSSATYSSSVDDTNDVQPMAYANFNSNLPDSSTSSNSSTSEPASSAASVAQAGGVLSLLFSLCLLLVF